VKPNGHQLELADRHAQLPTAPESDSTLGAARRKRIFRDQIWKWQSGRWHVAMSSGSGNLFLDKMEKRHMPLQKFNLRDIFNQRYLHSRWLSPQNTCEWNPVQKASKIDYMLEKKFLLRSDKYCGGRIVQCKGRNNILTVLCATKL
jgi:hypothetical protein